MAKVDNGVVRSSGSLVPQTESKREWLEMKTPIIIDTTNKVASAVMVIVASFLLIPVGRFEPLEKFQLLELFSYSWSKLPNFVLAIDLDPY